MAVPRITREELKARLDAPDSSSHPVILDVRLKYPYEHSTVKLPAAIHLLPDAVDAAALPRDRDVVVYDSDPNDMVAVEAAARLIRSGLRASVLQGGIGEWVGAKLPVDAKPAPQLAASMVSAKAEAPAKPSAPPKPANPAAQQEAAAARPDDSPPAEPTR
jgi:rhodanese-related sulfurtransferase